MTQNQSAMSDATLSGVRSPGMPGTTGKSSKQASQHVMTQESASKDCSQKTIAIEEFQNSEFITSDELRPKHGICSTMQDTNNVSCRESMSQPLKTNFGTWDSSVKYDQIEQYLVSSQRKFVKYRLNIFYLNSCALKIQHCFFRAQQRRRRDKEQILLLQQQSSSNVQWLESPRQKDQRTLRFNTEEEELDAQILTQKIPSKIHSPCNQVVSEITTQGGYSQAQVETQYFHSETFGGALTSDKFEVRGEKQVTVKDDIKDDTSGETDDNAEYTANWHNRDVTMMEQQQFDEVQRTHEDLEEADDSEQGIAGPTIIEVSDHKETPQFKWNTGQNSQKDSVLKTEQERLHTNKLNYSTNNRVRNEITQNQSSHSKIEEIKETKHQSSNSHQMQQQSQQQQMYMTSSNMTSSHMSSSNMTSSISAKQRVTDQQMRTMHSSKRPNVQIATYIPQQATEKIVDTKLSPGGTTRTMTTTTVTTMKVPVQSNGSKAARSKSNEKQRFSKPSPQVHKQKMYGQSNSKKSSPQQKPNQSYKQFSQKASNDSYKQVSQKCTTEFHDDFHMTAAYKADGKKSDDKSNLMNQRKIHENTIGKSQSKLSVLYEQKKTESKASYDSQQVIASQQQTIVSDSTKYLTESQRKLDVQETEEKEALAQNLHTLQYNSQQRQAVMETLRKGTAHQVTVERSYDGLAKNHKRFETHQQVSSGPIIEIKKSSDEKQKSQDFSFEGAQSNAQILKASNNSIQNKSDNSGEYADQSIVTERLTDKNQSTDQKTHHFQIIDNSFHYISQNSHCENSIEVSSKTIRTDNTMNSGQKVPSPTKLDSNTQSHATQQNDSACSEPYHQNDLQVIIADNMKTSNDTEIVTVLPSNNEIDLSQPQQHSQSMQQIKTVQPMNILYDQAQSSCQQQRLKNLIMGSTTSREYADESPGKAALGQSSVSSRSGLSIDQKSIEQKRQQQSIQKQLSSTMITPKSIMRNDDRFYRHSKVQNHTISNHQSNNQSAQKSKMDSSQLLQQKQAQKTARYQNVSQTRQTTVSATRQMNVSATRLPPQTSRPSNILYNRWQNQSASKQKTQQQPAQNLDLSNSKQQQQYQQTLSLMTEEERKAIREKQLASVNRLTMTSTVASKGKSRKVSTSGERPSASNKPPTTQSRNEDTSSQAKLQVLNQSKASIQTKNKRDISQDSIRMVSPRPEESQMTQQQKIATARQAAAEALRGQFGWQKSSRKNQQTVSSNAKTTSYVSGGQSRQTTTITTTHYFVNGKEQRQTASTSQLSKVTSTPRISTKKTQQLQQATSTRNLRDQNMKQSRSRSILKSSTVATATVVNQQGKAQQQNFNNKPAKRPPTKDITVQQSNFIAQEGCVMGGMQKFSGTEDVSVQNQNMTDTLSRSYRQSGQAGGIEIQTQQNIVRKEKSAIDHSFDGKLHQQTSTKKMTQSFHGTTSGNRQRTSIIKHQQNKKQLKEIYTDEENFIISQKSLPQTSSSRGIPSAMKARANVRNKHFDPSQSVESNQNETSRNLNKIDSKIDSQQSYDKSSQKSVQAATKIITQPIISSDGTTPRGERTCQTTRPSILTKGCIAAGQGQLFSEQHDKSTSQITDEPLYQEQNRFLTEHCSDVNESLKNFEREEAKALQEELLLQSKTPRHTTIEYDKVTHMQIQLKTQHSSKLGSKSQSTEGCKTGKSHIPPMFIKEETKTHINKSFNEDIFFSKVETSFRRDFIQIKEVLQQHYTALVAVFIFYAGQSHAYPALSVEDFQTFCRETGLLGKQGIVTDAAIMKCFTQTIATTNQFKKKGERCLNRYEFLEILVFIAAMINKESANKPLNESIGATLQLLIGNVVLPNAQTTCRTRFWQLISSDSRVIELITQNGEVIYSVFRYFTNEKKQYVTLEECVAIVRQSQLEIDDKLLGVIFAESQQLVIDTMRNKEVLFQLSFAEFVYFLCRVSDVHFEDSHYEGEEFWVKFDNVITRLLEPFDLKPVFRYNAKFVYDTHRITDTANKDYLLEQDEEYEDDTQDIEHDSRAAAVPASSQKVESTRYSNVDEAHEEDCEEISSMQADALHESDIQAWPQPSPIAYPQRREMCVSPSMTSEDVQSASGITEDATIGFVPQVHYKKMSNRKMKRTVQEQEALVIRQRQNIQSCLKTTTISPSTKFHTYVKTQSSETLHKQ